MIQTTLLETRTRNSLQNPHNMKKKFFTSDANVKDNPGKWLKAQIN